jgi:hypothetical protein
VATAGSALKSSCALAQFIHPKKHNVDTKKVCPAHNAGLFFNDNVLFKNINIKSLSFV